MWINSQLRLLFLIFISCQITLFAQTDNFDLQAYKNFLSSHRDMTRDQLNSLHSSGVFQGSLQQDFSPSLYYDSIKIKFELTPGEMSLIDKNGFMVTERFRMRDFKTAFQSIYTKDLPVFITTDAVLDAVHRSYNKILKDIEVDMMIPKLTEFLKKLHDQLPALAAVYQSDPKMEVMLKDLDIYLTVAGKLLDDNITPYYPSNSAFIADLLLYINAGVPLDVNLFSDSPKTIDFSQFIPRGHYVDQYQPKLAQYFKAMMWLGRIEIYLSAPRARFPKPSEQDIQRQTILAALVLESVEKSNSFQLYDDIDGILRFFVGEPDNVTLPNIKTLTQDLNITNANQLLDSLTFKNFQNTLKTKSFAFQRILSQIIETGFNDPDSIVPASAFLLLGQRFVLDSYITSQVVFDMIKFNDVRIKRMLPSTQDVLFALGNDASAQILKKELDAYHYGTNLAALRYLTDSYGDDFWNMTIYNMWLNSIRKLNPPDDRTKLPLFMQTGAFWQEKMNTQLSSWAQLRHDNILYAKQSYSGAMTCAYPYAYAEPFPEFYKQIKLLADRAKDYFQKFTSTNPQRIDNVVRYFGYLSAVSDTLAAVASKELNNVSLSERETRFLKSVLSYQDESCGGYYNGWYIRLLYFSTLQTEDKDCVVADIHTAPTDSLADPVGWVLHAGTGLVNLGVFIVDSQNNNHPTAYVGPVMSYYEHLSTNFKRLTDDEWETSILNAHPNPYSRPDFVNAYLADNYGRVRPEGASLVTAVKDNKGDKPVLPESIVLAGNFPNPFNSSTVIKYTIPYNLSLQRAKLVIYNVQGEVVRELLNESLPSGTYMTRWEGQNSSGNAVPSGIYFYSLTIGNKTASGKMSLIK